MHFNHTANLHGPWTFAMREMWVWGTYMQVLRGMKEWRAVSFLWCKHRRYVCVLSTELNEPSTNFLHWIDRKGTFDRWGLSKVFSWKRQHLSKSLYDSGKANSLSQIFANANSMPSPRCLALGSGSKTLTQLSKISSTPPTIKARSLQALL